MQRKVVSGWLPEERAVKQGGLYGRWVIQAGSSRESGVSSERGSSVHQNAETCHSKSAWEGQWKQAAISLAIWTFFCGQWEPLKAAEPECGMFQEAFLEYSSGMG